MFLSAPFTVLPPPPTTSPTAVTSALCSWGACRQLPLQQHLSHLPPSPSSGRLLPCRTTSTLCRLASQHCGSRHRRSQRGGRPLDPSSAPAAPRLTPTAASHPCSCGAWLPPMTTTAVTFAPCKWGARSLRLRGLIMLGACLLVPHAAPPRTDMRQLPPPTTVVISAHCRWGWQLPHTPRCQAGNCRLGEGMPHLLTREAAGECLGNHV
mmetsp:Transcript_13177/g.37103  ORF Transcript_13177/g.37103 Transcript_13177/m.37103 type:complete len:209 (-) Transcript_13177:218-844(-)